ncbi:MAG: hypothetical protein WCK16_01625 [Candidatus Moraniibacteriota bacterium]
MAIDKDGDIYVVETKLYKNPDKRTVVAQALDYGASLWKHTNDFDEFINIIDKEVQAKFKMTFQEKAKAFFEIDEEQINLMLENIKFNLKDGNIKFVILMDSMDERLKDLIIYVNQNSRFDIYAVQLEYYKFQEYEIMIPKMFGVEVEKNVRTSSDSSQRMKWNEDGFLMEIKKLKAETKNKIETLLNFSKKENCLRGWGTGKVPVFNFKVKNPNDDGESTVFAVWSDGYMQVGFWLIEHEMDKEIPEVIDEFFKKINTIKGLDGNKEQVRTNNFQIDNIGDEGIKKLQEYVLWLKNSITRS